jgi:PAS domain S-box-containing protein
MDKADPQKRPVPADEDCMATHAEGDARLDEQGIIQNLQKQLAAKEAELQRVRVELTRVSAELASLSIKKPIIDDNDPVSGSSGVGIDSTHEKQIERESRESEEKYRDLVERISDVIYAVDRTGELTYVNPAVESLLGYLPSEVIGQPFSRFVLPEDLEKIRDSFEQLSNGIEPGPNVYRVLTKAGEVRWIRTSSEPIVDGEQVSGVRGVLTDITNRVRAEAQREQAAVDAERERLSRELHDAVTQTLFSIAAIAEVLPDTWERDPDKARRGLQELQELAQGAVAEMRTLLLAWRPEALLSRDLGELIHQLGDGMAARTRMPVTTTVVGEYPLSAEVKLALYRIAQEALNNVVKHAGANRAIVRLECTGEQVTLSISDNGRGFDPADVPLHHFGLGIMRERALAVGATFAVASEPGRGTEITATWEDATQMIGEGQ